jgi:PAS domain S-box-containing protein
MEVVLVVEDDADCARLFEALLEETGLETSSVGTVASAREQIAARRPDLVLLDIGLPDGSGLSLIGDMERFGDDAPAVVVASGFADDAVERALSAGARDFLAKPVRPVELISRVRAALDERRNRRQVLQLLAAERTARYEAGAAARRARALVDAIRLVAESSGNDLNQTLSALASEARALLRADHAIVHLSGSVDNEFAYAATAAKGRYSRGAGIRQQADGFMREAFATGKPLFTADFQGDSRIDPESKRRRPDVVASMTVPLVADGQLRGVLFLHWSRSHVVSSAELELAEAFGRHAAVATHTAKLLDDARRNAAALRDSEERYRRIVDDVPDVVYRWDVAPTLRLSYFSQAGERLTGYTLDDLAGDAVYQLIHPDDRGALRERLDRMLRGEHDPTPGTIRWIDRAGRTLWVETRSSPMRDADGRLLAVEGIARDVTDRVRADQALRFQAHLLNCVEQAIAVTDLDGRITYWNGFAERLYGWTVDEAVGRNLIELVSAEPWPRDEARKMARAQAGERSLREVELTRRDGSKFVGMVQSTPLHDDLGQLTGTVTVSFDLTAQRLAEEERDRLSEEIVLLEERQRIAMDLHDGAIQSLYGVALSLAAADRVAGAGKWPSDVVRSAVAEINGVMGAVREYVYALRDSASTAVELGAELQAIALTMRAQGLEVDLELDPRLQERLPRDLAAHLLQVAREATSNVLRHSGASSAAVRLTLPPGLGALTLSVVDDGRGFDPTAADATAGIGLGSMLDRAAKIGADLWISTTPGYGTAIHLTRRLPMEAE